MPIHVHKEPNCEYDALRAIVMLHNNDSVEEYKQSIIDRYPGYFNEENAGSFLNGTIDLHRQIGKTYTQSPRSEFLFLNEFDMRPVANIFFHGEEKHDKNLAALYVSLSEEIDEAENRLFESPKEFFEFVDNLNLHIENKYKLVKAYNQFDEWKKEYALFTAPAIKVIEDNKHLFEKQLSDFHLIVSELIAKDGHNFLENIASLELDSEANYNIYPCLTSPNEIRLQGLFKDLSSVDLYIGHTLFQLADRIDIARTNSVNNREFLKILADPTKLSILEMLKNEPAYAIWLA